MGKLKFTHIEISSPIKKIIVATESNVLLALSLKTGDIVWRQVLESGEAGSIRLLSVDNEIVTISGQSLPLVRGWGLEHGHLLWEWPLTSHNEYTKWISIGQNLVQIDLYPKSNISVILFNGSNGKKMRSQIIPAIWLDPDACILQSDVLCCITGDKLIYSIKLTDGIGDLDIKVHHRSLFDLFQEDVTGNLKEVPGPLPVVTLNVGNIDKPIILQPEIKILPNGNEQFEVFSTAFFDQQSILTSAFLTGEVSYCFPF